MARRKKKSKKRDNIRKRSKAARKTSSVSERRDPKSSRSGKGASKPEFSKKEVEDAINLWLAENSDAPDLVKTALESYLKLLDALESKSAAVRRLATELQKAFGIRPKSERATNYGTKSPRKSRRQSLIDQIEDARTKACSHEKHGRKQRKKVKDLKLKLKELDEIELSPEEEAEIAENQKTLLASLEAGGDRTDLICAKPSEEILQGIVSGHEKEEIECKLDPTSRKNAKKIFTEERERLDVEISVCHKILTIEKAEVTGEDGLATVVSASTKEYGPPRMNVTWNFLSQMSILVAQYAMPMRRFASLLSTPNAEVAPDRIQRYFIYVASRFAPLYIHNLKSLANSDILAGDDTTTRTLEIIRALKNGTKPWEDYATPKDCAALFAKSPDEAESSLPAKIGLHFDFVSQAKVSGRDKLQFNTTVIHGRTVAEDPKSTVVIFRSHFGGFGDLLTQLLSYRDPENKTLTTVTDLLSSNTARHQNFSIIQAGCASHARRRFKQAEEDYPDWAGAFLSDFGVTYAHEEALNLKGRNIENTNAVRKKCSNAAWERMFDDAEEIKEMYSSSTKIGEAARYLLNHKTELTRYLYDPRLPHTNDLSERLLRPEKQIQASALFRDTIQGRAALDIMRSVIQTAVASKVNATEYIDWYLRQEPEEIENNPEEFTSLKYLAKQG